MRSWTQASNEAELMESVIDRIGMLEGVPAVEASEASDSDDAGVLLIGGVDEGFASNIVVSVVDGEASTSDAPGVIPVLWNGSDDLDVGGPGWGVNLIPGAQGWVVEERLTYTDDKRTASVLLRAAPPARPWMRTIVNALASDLRAAALASEATVAPVNVEGGR